MKISLDMIWFKDVFYMYTNPLIIPHGLKKKCLGYIWLVENLRENTRERKYRQLIGINIK